MCVYVETQFTLYVDNISQLCAILIIFGEFLYVSLLISFGIFRKNEMKHICAFIYTNQLIVLYLCKNVAKTKKIVTKNIKIRIATMYFIDDE